MLEKNIFLSDLNPQLDRIEESELDSGKVMILCFDAFNDVVSEQQSIENNRMQPSLKPSKFPSIVSFSDKFTEVLTSQNKFLCFIKRDVIGDKKFNSQGELIKTSLIWGSVLQIIFEDEMERWMKEEAEELL